MTHSGRTEFGKRAKRKSTTRRVERNAMYGNRARVIVLLLLTMHSCIRNVESVCTICLCSARQKIYIIYLAEKSIVFFLFVSLLCFGFLLVSFFFLRRDCCVLYCSFSFRLYLFPMWRCASGVDAILWTTTTTTTDGVGRRMHATM